MTSYGVAKSMIRYVRYMCLLALLLAPSAGAFAETWDDVVAAAKKEGKLVWYTNQRVQSIEPLLERFREAYPEIETEAVRLSSNAMMERFLTEYSAGRHLADVVTTFGDDSLIAGLKEGWMEQWSPPELMNFPPEVNRDNKLFTISTAREVIIWNKTLVSDADAPKEWADLFDPKWKGKVGINPPWRSIAIQQIIAYWRQLGLGDTAAKLKANEVRFFEGAGGVLQAVIRGDVHVAEMTDSTLNPILEDGAPIGFVYPASGTTTAPSVCFVAKNAPHPNAAKVFLNWLMTEEGQSLTALPGMRNGTPPMTKLPANSELANVVDGM